MNHATGRPAPAAGRRRAVVFKLGVSGALTLGGLALIEGIASLWLNATETQLLVVLPEQSHSRHDPDLGWSHEPGAHLVDHYGPGRSITVNSQGFRALEEYTPAVPEGRFRVVCVGDSFTMGFGVDDGDTFAARLQSLCPAVQTVNMGMGGYGLDQAFLWYARDGAALQADMLLFTVIDADFYRTGMDAFVGYPKPRFVVRDGELVVTNVPVPRVIGRSDTGRRWLTFLRGTALARLSRDAVESAAAPEDDGVPAGDAAVEMFDRAERIFDAAVELATRRGQQVMFMYLPTKKLVYLRQRSAIHRWMTNYAARRELPLVDLMGAFDDVPLQELVDDVYLPDNHFDVRGNVTIAEALLDALHGSAKGFPGCGEGGRTR